MRLVRREVKTLDRDMKSDRSVDRSIESVNTQTHTQMHYLKMIFSIVSIIRSSYRRSLLMFIHSSVTWIHGIISSWTCVVGIERWQLHKFTRKKNRRLYVSIHRREIFFFSFRFFFSFVGENENGEKRHRSRLTIWWGCPPGWDGWWWGGWGAAEGG